MDDINTFSFLILAIIVVPCIIALIALVGNTLILAGTVGVVSYYDKKHKDEKYKTLSKKEVLKDVKKTFIGELIIYFFTVASLSVISLLFNYKLSLSNNTIPKVTKFIEFLKEYSSMYLIPLLIVICIITIIFVVLGVLTWIPYFRKKE